MTRLGVNIDHVATVRQARREPFPDPVKAALAAAAAGADGITAHLREDRRHIQDDDMLRLRENLSVPLNMEMASSPEIVTIAEKIKPAWACLVPEKRQELTTEGGLLVPPNQSHLKETVNRLHGAGIKVSFFIEPDREVVALSKELGADAVELHTGRYARMWVKGEAETELVRIRQAAEKATQAGLFVNAGHGIDYENAGPLLERFEFHELNIGFSIVARALFVGIGAAVREMKDKMRSVCAES